MREPDYKSLSPKARSELALEFIKSFHGQFATNQNHHRSVFVQVIVVLVPLLSGYGYLFLKVFGAQNDGADANSYVAALHGYLLITAVIMSLETAVLLIMSVSYRRDQYVSALMREKWAF